ncbi:MAG TPA: SAM-dependent methyltransferase, partial [Sphingomicrobium sp.]|nr:SAM-dependent methyltransferase [Sphingomicrobium sp.]
DVIEHIDDDRAALAAIAAKLKRGGKFVMTVPAHQWMWSAHDVVNHHKRRYSKASLRRLVEGSPLKLEKLGYFNSLLFPLAVAERFSSKLRGKDDADVKLPSEPLNAALRAVFGAERHLVGRLPLPPGLSLFAVASAI